MEEDRQDTLRFTGERVVPDDMTDSPAEVANYQRHLYRYLFALGYAANKKTLDAACGTGYGTALLSTVASHALGVDVDERAIEYAQAHYSAGYPNCEYRRCDLDKADFGASTWEAVVSFETIEHLPRPEYFLETVHRALVPGGLLVASLPIDSPSEYHSHVYDLPAARELFRGCGLSVLSILGQHEMSLVSEALEAAPYLLFVCEKDQLPPSQEEPMPVNDGRLEGLD